jgi:hypothetical protein
MNTIPVNENRFHFRNGSGFILLCCTRIAAVAAAQAK